MTCSFSLGVDITCWQGLLIPGVSLPIHIDFLKNRSLHLKLFRNAKLNDPLRGASHCTAVPAKHAGISDQVFFRRDQIHKNLLEWVWKRVCFTPVWRPVPKKRQSDSALAFPRTAESHGHPI
jgi:hypothetical protein